MDRIVALYFETIPGSLGLRHLFKRGFNSGSSQAQFTTEVHMRLEELIKATPISINGVVLTGAGIK